MISNAQRLENFYRDYAEQGRRSLSLLDTISRSMEWFLATDIGELLTAGDVAITANDVNAIDTTERTRGEAINKTRTAFDEVLQEFKQTSRQMIETVANNAASHATVSAYNAWARDVVREFTTLSGALVPDSLEYLLEGRVDSMAFPNINGLMDNVKREVRAFIERTTAAVEARNRTDVPSRLDLETEVVTHYQDLVSGQAVEQLCTEVLREISQLGHRKKSASLYQFVLESLRRFLPHYVQQIIELPQGGKQRGPRGLKRFLTDIHQEFDKAKTFHEQAIQNSEQMVVRIQESVQRIMDDRGRSSEAVAIMQLLAIPSTDKALAIAEGIITKAVSLRGTPERAVRELAQDIENILVPGGIIDALDSLPDAEKRNRGLQDLLDAWQNLQSNAQYPEHLEFEQVRMYSKIVRENEELKIRNEKLSTRAVLILKAMHRIAADEGWDREQVLKVMDETGDLNRIATGLITQIAEHMESDGLRPKGSSSKVDTKRNTKGESRQDVLKGQSLIVIPRSTPAGIGVQIRLDGTPDFQEFDLQAIANQDDLTIFRNMEVVIHTQALEKLTHFLRLVVGKVNGNLIEAVDTQLLFGKSPMGVILSDEFNIRIGVLDSIDTGALSQREKDLLQKLQRIRANAHIPGGMEEDLYYKTQIYWQALLSYRHTFDQALEKFVYPSYDSCIRSVFNLLRGSPIYRRDDVLIYDFISSDVAHVAFAALVANTLNYNANVNNVKATSAKSYTMDINNSEHQAYVNFFMSRCRPKPYFSPQRDNDRFEVIDKTGY